MMNDMKENLFDKHDPSNHLVQKIRNMKPGDKQQTTRDHYLELSEDGKTFTIHNMSTKG